MTRSKSQEEGPNSHCVLETDVVAENECRRGWQARLELAQKTGGMNIKQNLRSYCRLALSSFKPSLWSIEVIVQVVVC